MMRINSLIIAIFCTIICSAHDFSVMDGNNTLFYNITDTIKNEVELTYSGSIRDLHKSYVGDLIIKRLVTYKGKSYKVTAIGRKAFADNNLLTSVEIPNAVRRIDDFAFENCQKLNRVIMPTNEVVIGTGAFFLCSNISRLSIGAEWTVVDLKHFCWSKELKKISIPARVKQIENMISLPFLQEIVVDENNAKFSSFDGALYNVNRTELLRCPRGRSGKLVVDEKTETIRWGALNKCVGLDEIILQKNIKYLSFREFSELRNLKKLQLQTLSPILTATHNGKNVMALQLANRSVRIEVAREMKKVYCEAISTESGMYSEINANKSLKIPENLSDIEFNILDSQLAAKSQIVVVKEFK